MESYKTQRINPHWICPLPLKNYPNIVMGHGSGGRMMHDLIKHLFLPAFDNPTLQSMADSAIVEFPHHAENPVRLAFSTDSYVVNPLVFPGGDIGELAVNGTINDLAMTGAQPFYLSAGLILEEGLEIALLAQIIESIAKACKIAGVELVTGDTKVVNRGHGDGVYINTAGIGVIPPGIRIQPDQARPGDVVLVSGTVGDHGMAVMSVREGLSFEIEIQSDTQPLHSLVKEILTICPDVHCMRDVTRGGLAAVLNELASTSSMGIEMDETAVPVKPAVQAACELLGIDPWFVANEGLMVCILPEKCAEAALEAMRAHPAGKESVRIGKVVETHPGMVLARTTIGGTRVVDLPAGEILPRIC